MQPLFSRILTLFLPYFTSRTAHILVYHSTSQQVPEALKQGLHNVAPEVLYRQLSWIKSRFDVVRIDDLFTSRDIRGKAAVTIDDGYTSFLREGFPVVKTLKIPCTLFLCGATVEGKIFWRDKVRYLINHRLLRAFLDYLDQRGISYDGLTEDNFYKKSKSPRINSGSLNAFLDEFLEERGEDLKDMNFCIRHREELVRDPLLDYGNHSFDHFVLSSLSDDEQERQIEKNHAFLKNCGVNMSRVFSVPFGGACDFNEATISVLKRLGYIGCLLTPGKINLRGGKDFSFACLNRYLPAPDLTMFKGNLKRMTVRQLLFEGS